jgi:hypothetical protein
MMSELVIIKARIIPITVREGEVENFLSRILPGIANKTSGITVARAILTNKMKEKKSRFFIIGTVGRISKIQKRSIL